VQYPDGHWGETALTVVIFRLDQYDAAGNRSFSIPVEMRGSSFTGQLEDGDRVSVSGKVSGGVLYASGVLNTDNGAWFAVRVESSRSRRGLVQKIVLALISLFMVGSFVAIAIPVLRIIGVVGSNLSDLPSVPGNNAPSVPGGGIPLFPTDDQAPQTLTMPDLVGENNVSAVQLMSRAGFDPRNVLIDPVSAPDSQFGRVVRTSPKAGKKVSSDAVVRLYIGSNGP
jgi:hypothetical protein